MSSALAPLEHARTAVDRTAGHLEELAGRWRDRRTACTQQHQRLVEHAMRDLALRHAHLAQLYREMCEAPPGDLPVRWQRFFTEYDAFLDEVRDVRARLARQGTDGARR